MISTGELLGVDYLLEQNDQKTLETDLVMVYDTLDRLEKELKEDSLPEEDEGFLEGPTDSVSEYVGPARILNFIDDAPSQTAPSSSNQTVSNKAYRNKGCMTDCSLCSATDNRGLNGYGHVEELAVSLVEHLMSANEQASHATFEDICRLNGKLFQTDRQPSLNLHTPKKGHATGFRKSKLQDADLRHQVSVTNA